VKGGVNLEFGHAGTTAGYNAKLTDAELKTLRTVVEWIPHLDSDKNLSNDRQAAALTIVRLLRNSRDLTKAQSNALMLSMARMFTAYPPKATHATLGPGLCDEGHDRDVLKETGRAAKMAGRRWMFNPAIAIASVITLGTAIPIAAAAAAGSFVKNAVGRSNSPAKNTSKALAGMSEQVEQDFTRGDSDPIVSAEVARALKAVPKKNSEHRLELFLRMEECLRLSPICLDQDKPAKQAQAKAFRDALAGENDLLRARKWIEPRQGSNRQPLPKMK
jgi:hypothetical protein